MKYLSRAHLEKLEALKKEQLLLACVERLKSLSLDDAFPSKQEAYYAFAKHVYGVAQTYGLRDKRALFALLLAWHIKGDAICKDPHVVKVLNDTTLSSSQKGAFFEQYSLDTITIEEQEA